MALCFLFPLKDRKVSGIPLHRASLLRLGGFYTGPGGKGPKELPPLIHLTDEIRFPDPLPAIARLPQGSLVVFRHYQTPARQQLAHHLAAFCKSRGLCFLIAGDAALAVATRADGLHLPKWLARGPVSRGWAWRHRKPGWLLTAAVHSQAALLRAERAGADAVLLSPLFPTASHPQARPLGIARFAALAHRARIPVYGLGGLNATTAPRIRGAGAAGIAVVSVFAEKNGDRL